jgi:peptidoglycan/xylan/chitin deacetylase (PgdA/CDA1 family)
MAGWDDLRRELEGWADSERQATFWWRDDDAEAPGPELARLLALAERSGVAPALAVVPAGAGRPLVETLAGGHDVLTHGLRHRNLAPAGERKAEFGPHRPLCEMLADAAAGRERLRQLFGHRALPVFVPPWNRLAAALTPHLPDAGFAALSTLSVRARADPAPGLRQVNCHVDPINWRGARAFVGEPAALDAVLTHLRARRLGHVDAGEPTGVMSHHRVQDDATWGFLERLFWETRECDGAHWLSPREVFSLAP